MMKTRTTNIENNSAVEKFVTPSVSGIVGALALTAIHQAAKALSPNAPQVDKLGMKAIKKTFTLAHLPPPGEEKTKALSFAGDIAFNSAFYAFTVGLSKNRSYFRPLAAGLTVGAATLFIPQLLGKGKRDTQRTPETMAMTLAWYVVGAFATEFTVRALRSNAKTA